MKRILLAATLPVPKDVPENRFRPVTTDPVDVDEDPFSFDDGTSSPSRAGSVSPNAYTADSPAQKMDEVSWKDVSDPATSSGIVMPGFDCSSMCLLLPVVALGGVFYRLWLLWQQFV